MVLFTLLIPSFLYSVVGPHSFAPFVAALRSCLIGRCSLFIILLLIQIEWLYHQNVQCLSEVSFFWFAVIAVMLFFLLLVEWILALVLTSFFLYQWKQGDDKFISFMGVSLSLWPRAISFQSSDSWRDCCLFPSELIPFQNLKSPPLNIFHTLLRLKVGI